MDLKRIFIKDACPTKTGGQAVLNGIMMKGATRTAVAVRLPDETMHIRIEENKPPMKVAKIPFVRGVFVFVNSLVQGTKRSSRPAHSGKKCRPSRSSSWQTLTWIS